MDVRELEILKNEASWLKLEESLNWLHLLRAAQYDEKNYKSVINQLRQGMQTLQVGKTETVRQTWAELRRGR